MPLPVRELSGGALPCHRCGRSQSTAGPALLEPRSAVRRRRSSRVQIVSTFPVSSPIRPAAARLLGLRDLTTGRRGGHLVRRAARVGGSRVALAISPNLARRTRWRGSSRRPLSTLAPPGGTRCPAADGSTSRRFSGAGGSAAAVPATRSSRTTTPANAPRLHGSRPDDRATIDCFDDPRTSTASTRGRGSASRVSVDGPKAQRPTLVLWRPGTTHVTLVTPVAVRSGEILACKTGVDPVLRAGRGGPAGTTSTSGRRRTTTAPTG